MNEAHGSSKAVITALVANAILTVLKFIAALFTHSASIFRKQMRKHGETSFLQSLLRSKAPTLVAVVLEDTAATLGVLLAATGIVLTALSGNPYWDIGFSMVIAALLGLTAFFLGAVNMRYLSDVLDRGAEAAFVNLVKQHSEVERYHDLRSIIIDDRYTILVAEIELREEAVVAGLQARMAEYEDKFLSMLPNDKCKDERLRDYCHTRAAAQATLERTETIIEELAQAIKQRLPHVHHVTLEVEGIATTPGSEEGTKHG